MNSIRIYQKLAIGSVDRLILKQWVPLAATLLLLAIEYYLLIPSFHYHSFRQFPDSNLWTATIGHFDTIRNVFCLFLILFQAMRLRQIYDTEALPNFRHFVSFFPAQAISFALFYFSCASITLHATSEAPVPGLLLISWYLFGICTAAFTTKLLMGGGLSSSFLSSDLKIILIALTVSILSLAIFPHISQQYWEYLVAYTFHGIEIILTYSGVEDFYSDATEKLLSLKDFTILVEKECSGLEGIGIITAFTALYIYLFRQELHFPQAFLLFPIAGFLIWILNCFRIATLLAIGAYWSPDIAVNGFHSTAGWIGFAASSFFVIWLSAKSRFFSKPRKFAHAAGVTERSIRPPANFEIASLAPFVAFIGSSLVFMMFVADFDYLYPVRILIPFFVLFALRKHYAFLAEPISLLSLACGAAVALTWITLHESPADDNLLFTSSLTEMNSTLASLWLVMRVLGTTLIVPMVEELTFRCYLLCKILKVDVSASGNMPASLSAIIITSLAFGFLHGDWIAGTVAGLLFAILRVKSNNIAHCVAAHCIANIVVFLYAILTGEWTLI